DIKKLGNIGDVVTVKNGFGRNFLIPQKKALLANSQNKKYYEERKTEIVKQNDGKKQEAKKVFDLVEGKIVTLIKEANEEKKLYGSVMPKEIAGEVSKTCKTQIKKRQIILNTVIRQLGIYEIKCDIHADYIASVTLNIARNKEEAKQNLTLAKEENAQDEVPAKKVKEEKKTKEVASESKDVETNTKEAVPAKKVEVEQTQEVAPETKDTGATTKEPVSVKDEIKKSSKEEAPSLEKESAKKETTEKQS
ncbi:MAG: 50S ribosomal protein L9, partial [Flavobacteriales bacterium]|nr:50S ribosomal protein L9 [Flavobacteriales bacterium]